MWDEWEITGQTWKLCREENFQRKFYLRVRASRSDIAITSRRCPTDEIKSLMFVKGLKGSLVAPAIICLIICSDEKLQVARKLERTLKLKLAWISYCDR